MSKPHFTHVSASAGEVGRTGVCLLAATGAHGVHLAIGRHVGKIKTFAACARDLQCRRVDFSGARLWLQLSQNRIDASGLEIYPTDQRRNTLQI